MSTIFYDSYADRRNRQDRGRSHRELARGAPPVLVAGQTLESAVDLDQTKLHARISGGVEDTKIQEFIDDATNAVQLDAEIALITQSRIQYLDDFPDGPIELRMPPFQSVT